MPAQVCWEDSYMIRVSARGRALIVSLVLVSALAVTMLPAPTAMSHVGTPAPVFESLATNGSVSYGNPAHKFANGYLDVDITFAPCSPAWSEYVGIFVRGLDSSGAPSSAWAGPVMSFNYGSNGNGSCPYPQPIHKSLRVINAPGVGTSTFHEVEYRGLTSGTVFIRARNTDRVASNAVNGLPCLGTHPAHGGGITDCRAIYYNGNIAYGNPNFSVAGGKANLDISWGPCDRDWAEGANVWLRGTDASGNPVTNWKAILSFDYSGSGCTTYVQPIHKHGLTTDSAIAAAPFHEMEFRGQASGKVFLRSRSWGAGARVEDTLGPMCTGNAVPYAVNPSACQSDPVNSATGAFVTSVDDLRMSGVGIPFRMTRSYTSIDRMTGPLGRGWTHSFASALITESNGDKTLRSENGQRTRFALQADGTFKAFRGGRATLTAITGGLQVKTPDQSVVRFDTAGRPTAFFDPHENGLTLAYSTGGTLSTVTDDAGRVATFTHDAAGRLTNVALPDGRSTSYAYTKGLLTKVTDVRGHDTTYQYDEHDRLSKIVDQNGNAVVTNTYGADNRVSEQVDARGNKTTFSWDPATETSTMTDARGGTWKDVYSYNVLVKRIDPLGNETVFEHDAGLDVTAIVDPRGNKTRMAYDSEHNLTSVTTPAPLNDVTTFTYDSANRLTSYTNPRSKTTTLEYNAAGDLTKTTAPGSTVTQLARDSGTGLVTSVTDPRNETTALEYDAAGNLTKVTSPEGRVTTMGYDTAGRLTSIVEPRGNEAGATPADYKTTVAYNAANNVTSVTDALGNVTTRSFDPAGRLTSVTDAKNRTTSYGYNVSNLLTSVTAPESVVTGYTYDSVGNLTSRTDANNHTSAYAYDAADRLTEVTSPTGKKWTYAYDNASNLTSVVDAIGNASAQAGDGVTSYGYDVMNRLKTIDYSDSTPDVTFAYDANGNRASMADGAGTETYQYDDLDRLTSVTRGSDVFSYSYDAADNLTSRTYPGGSTSNLAYDADGLLESVTTAATTTTFGYNAAGLLTTKTLPSGNGHVEKRTYDRAGRLTEVENVKGTTVLSKATYVRDAVGNPSTVTTPTGTTSYSYDAFDRLTEACYQAACPGANDPFIRYTYDAVGNRLTEERPGGTTTYAYNAADQLQSATTGGVATSYDHDANGSLIQAGQRAFSYDAANRMSSTTSGADTTTYTYDGMGTRLSASSGTSAADVTKFLWDPNAGLPQLALERDGDDALLRRYEYGGGLLSMTAGSATSYFHTDGMGSVTDVTDSSGNAYWQYEYEPFGAQKSATKVDPGAPANPMGFTGEYLDPTGLYHLRARQYDPQLGRFGSTDPRTPPTSSPGVSPYAYVNNRPTVLVDPSGFCGWTSPWRCVDDAAKGAWHNASDLVGAPVALLATLAGGEIRNCGRPGYPEAICVDGSLIDLPWADAFTIGNYVIGGRGEGALEGCFLEHELTHVEQGRTLGPLYLPVYFAAGFIDMEAAAYSAQKACSLGISAK